MNLKVEYWLQTPYFIPFNMLAVTIDLLSGDDGDSMDGPGDHHLTNQNPLSAAWLELKDLSVVVVVRVVAIPSS